MIGLLSDVLLLWYAVALYSTWSRVSSDSSKGFLLDAFVLWSLKYGENKTHCNENLIERWSYLEAAAQTKRKLNQIKKTMENMFKGEICNIFTAINGELTAMYHLRSRKRVYLKYVKWTLLIVSGRQSLNTNSKNLHCWGKMTAFVKGVWWLWREQYISFTTPSQRTVWKCLSCRGFMMLNI